MFFEDDDSYGYDEMIFVNQGFLFSTKISQISAHQKCISSKTQSIADQ